MTNGENAFCTGCAGCVGCAGCGGVSSSTLTPASTVPREPMRRLPNKKPQANMAMDFIVFIPILLLLSFPDLLVLDVVKIESRRLARAAIAPTESGYDATQVLAGQVNG